MSIKTDLKAFSIVAPVIDPEITLYIGDCGGWFRRLPGHGYHIMPEDALAIRTQQAMNWLTAWCKANECTWQMDCNPHTGICTIDIYEIHDWDHHMPTVSGQSPAEALAARILTPNQERTNAYGG